jgi:hypothetical protein
VRVKIIEFADWGDREDDGGRLLFDAECDRRPLGRAVASELRRLFAFHGARGYCEKWVHYEFPADRLAAIEGILAQYGVQLGYIGWTRRLLRSLVRPPPRPPSAFTHRLVPALPMAMPPKGAEPAGAKGWVKRLSLGRNRRTAASFGDRRGDAVSRA